jgi:xylan 1,4-beta-xylosidase
VLNVFRMFSRMGGQRVTVASDGEVALDPMLRDGVRAQPDVSALASLDANRLCILVWHYADDDVPGPAAAVELGLTGLPKADGEARIEHLRIDADHSNAYTAWQRMGSPQQPTPDQYTQLERAGQLQAMGQARTITIENHTASIRFSLPRQAVSLVVVDW